MFCYSIFYQINKIIFVSLCTLAVQQHVCKLAVQQYGCALR